MAAAQRPGGQQAKICQFKLVLLGKLGCNNYEYGGSNNLLSLSLQHFLTLSLLQESQL